MQFFKFGAPERLAEVSFRWACRHCLSHGVSLLATMRTQGRSLFKQHHSGSRGDSSEVSAIQLLLASAACAGRRRASLVVHWLSAGYIPVRTSWALSLSTLLFKGPSSASFEDTYQNQKTCRYLEHHTLLFDTWPSYHSHIASQCSLRSTFLGWACSPWWP